MPSGRHTCLIYDGGPSEQLPVIVPLLEDGLRDGYRCLYLGDREALSLAAGALEARGVKVAAHAERGALVLSAARPHLEGGGAFTAEAMARSLETLVDQAVADGYAGLCATGDMAWELGEGADRREVVAYETRLEDLFRRKPLRGVCQYRRGTLPAPIYDAALETHAQAIVCRDLAAEERARLEREKATLERAVAERTEELRSFTYAASHDLKAPLRSISGFTTIIERRYLAALPAEARELFAHVRLGADRLAGLLDALLSFSRVGSGELRAEPVDLTALAQSALARLRAAEPGRRVHAVVQDGLTARGDARLLSLVLENLLGNAWKFTSRREDAQVELGACERDGQRAFFVRDDGAGFSPVQSERLFQPFQRLHSQGEFPGSGLGLATVKRIVERHGGRVWAEGSPGRGAVFYFTLPKS